MSYTIEEVSGCSKKFLFNLDHIDLSPELDTALKEKQKSSSLKGFRKGKVPLSIIQQVYGPQAEAGALHRFIYHQFIQAVQKEGIQVIGVPRFANTKYEKGQTVSFEATIEYLPELKLNNLSHFSFTKDDITVIDDEVKKVLNSQLEDYAEMVEVEDAVLAKGHIAVINFQGERENGERPENMKGEEFLLEIGSNNFIPGFEDALVGMKAEEEREINLVFPSDYHAQDLQNAKVKFEVNLLEIKEKRIPELTDELAKGLDHHSKEDMERETRKRLEYQKERQACEKLHKQIIDKLVIENQFDIPLALIAEQEKAVQEDATAELKSRGQSKSQIKEYLDKWASDITQKAVFQVRSGLILNKLADDYSIEVLEQDIKAKYDEMAEQLKLTREQVREHYEKNDTVMKNFRYAIQEEKTFQKIYEKIQLSSE